MTSETLFFFKQRYYCTFVIFFFPRNGEISGLAWPHYELAGKFYCCCYCYYCYYRTQYNPVTGPFCAVGCHESLGIGPTSTRGANGGNKNQDPLMVRDWPDIYSVRSNILTCYSYILWWGRYIRDRVERLVVVVVVGFLQYDAASYLHTSPSKTEGISNTSYFPSVRSSYIHAYVERLFGVCRSGLVTCSWCDPRPRAASTDNRGPRGQNKEVVRGYIS